MSKPDIQGILKRFHRRYNRAEYAEHDLGLEYITHSHESSYLDDGDYIMASNEYTLADQPDVTLEIKVTYRKPE
jgi:hypothetical protein